MDGVTPGAADQTSREDVINNISESYMVLSGELKENGWADEIIDRVESALNELIKNAIAHGNMFPIKDR